MEGIFKDFVEVLNQDDSFNEALEEVLNNASGKVWLIGGGVYRNLAYCLHGIEKRICDFDFIVEDLAQDIKLSPGWTLTQNRFGNPKFVKGDLKIDPVPLNNIASIIRRGIEPSFDNFLTGVPLTVQSIGYDVLEEKVYGDIGTKAVYEKKVGINNITAAHTYARKKVMKIEDIIKEKAESLGFTPVYD